MNEPLVHLTAQITKRFLATQTVAADQVPALITGVFQSLWEAEHPTPVAEPEVRAKRKYVRRAQGQAVEALAEQPQETQEAEQEEPAYVEGRPDDWRNDAAWDEHGQPIAQARPEPDFE